MPLKLVPPRAGRSSNWSVRGTHLGIRLDRSTGSPNRATARQILNRWKEDIERGALAARGEMTFAAATLAYLQAGGEARFIKPISEHFGAKTLARDVDQAAIDHCAVTLYPEATAATRNRQVYSPVSAILRHVGIERQLRRPRGAQGRQRIHWHSLDDASALVKAASKRDAEFGIFLTVLLYTGLRLSEGLALDCARIDLPHAMAFVPETKNDEPRAVHLPPPVVAALAGHPRGLDRKGPAFRFRKNGHLYNLMRDSAETAGVTGGFHILRHTYATWMRRYAKLTPAELVDTGAWRSLKSAKRYDHVERSEVAALSDRLPILKTGNGGKSAVHKKKGGTR